MAARGLGKGLDALIPSTIEVKNEKVKVDNSVDDSSEKLVKITMVEPNREQPRKNFDEDSLLELAESIKQFGLLQPILVQDRKTYYEIVAGERRWRAAKMAGLKEVPVIIRDLTEQEIVEISLIENIQREDLTGIEEARAYYEMKTQLGYTQAQIAKEVGKNRSHIANLLRLLTLPNVVQNYILEGKISTGHAKVLVGLDDKKAVSVANKIILDNLSVRDVEKLLLNEKPVKKTIKKQVQNDYSQIEKTLNQKLNYSRIYVKDKQIQIKFSSNEELFRFVEQLKVK